VHTISVGNAIESLVGDFLVQCGLTFVHRNYRCRLGEIDLIFNDTNTDTLVFVEVRYRANSDRGHATETVDIRKQQKIKRAARQYLQACCDARQCARIDVIGVSQRALQSDNYAEHSISTHAYHGYHLIWIRNAVEE